MRHNSGAVSHVTRGGVTHYGGAVSGVLIDSNNGSGTDTGVVTWNTTHVSYQGHVWLVSDVNLPTTLLAWATLCCVWLHWVVITSSQSSIVVTSTCVAQTVLATRLHQ